MRIHTLLIVLTALFFAACEKEEPIVDENPVELGATLTAEMGSDLSNQIYVNLSEGIMTSVAVSSWELAFENAGNSIRTNSGKKVAVTSPEETDFDMVSTDEGLVYSYDSQDQDLTTTAFAGWETNVPYIVDLGLDANGNVLGKKKIIITASSASEVSMMFADLDGSNAESETITKSDGDFTFFSLINNQTVTVEPDNWDFVLGGVSVRTGAPCAVLGGGAMPGINCDVYRLSASAVTNSYGGVQVAMDDPFPSLEQNDDPASERNLKSIADSNFDALDVSDFNSLGASSAGDAIGRTWLQILTPHSSGVYQVYDFITYIVKDQDGNYYKVRFLAYKGGNNAENGNPTFEYELISN